ncbi:MAG: UDP-2,3-diacylglucosamine diphosphatase LpxI [Bdellovibrionales bacterium]|nr:UDP-2,3-diacylglucosamine diphosphatase LpxI [Bdellovibrionales bacterium]
MEQLKNNVPLGLVAGNGQFPLQLVHDAKEQGIETVAALHEGEADSRLKDSVRDWTSVRVGQLGKIIRFFKKHGVQQVVFLGGIRRPSLLQSFRPDLIGLKVITKVKSVQDDRLLRGVAAEFEYQGFQVLDPAALLVSCLVDAEALTKRLLSETERNDALIGWRAARELGLLDIGQSVVVSHGMVVAVEAIEGTDQAIRRAGALMGKHPGIVVKLPKPQQDRRLDLPAIGPNTIREMMKARCSALVLERRGALLLEPSETVRLADEGRISIMAFESEEALVKHE